MGKMPYIAMKTDEIHRGGGGGSSSSSSSVESDLKELGAAARRLVDRTLRLCSGVGFATTTLKSLASFAAIYLLILDRTNWRTKMQTSLLVPYIFLSLPSVLFYFLSLRTSSQNHFEQPLIQFRIKQAYFGVPKYGFARNHDCLSVDWLEMAGCLLLLVVAPDFLADTIRSSVVGVMICLFIACYLLQEHIRASGGFRNALTKSHGIVLLLVYPIWFLVLYFL